MPAWTVLVYMRSLCFLILAATLACTAVPARAASPTPPRATCINMPDVAALDQYCPTLPGADGRGLNRGPLFSEVLPDKIIKRLEKAGPLGQALLALRLAAPRTKLGRDSRGRGLDADDLLERGAIGGNKTKLSANPFAVAARAVTNSELSVAFGSVLLMSTFGIAGAGWRRFRRRTTF